MSSAPSPPGDSADRARLRNRALLVLAARLLTIGVLLGGSLYLVPHGSSFTGQAMLWLIATAFGTTVAFAIALQRGAETALVAGAQVAVDLGLVTGLVYLTGGAYSGFGSLYAAVVLVAAVLMGPQPTVVVGAIALLLYLGLALGLATGWVAAAPDQAPSVGDITELSVAVLRTSVGLLVVGGLGAVLSARLSRARGEAARATRFSDDVVRSIAAGLVTVGDDGRIDSANERAAEALGTVPTALHGVAVQHHLPVEPGNHRIRVDGIATRADGTTFPVGLTRTPLRDASGAAHGSLILFQDVSELAMLREKAERAERLAALGRLAAGLAHEIRNPLGSISGSVELVRDGGALGEEDKRLLDLVLEEVTRLNELVSTMLSVGRPSTPDRAPVDVAVLLRDVVDVARSKAEIEIVLALDEPVRAHADASQLRQVLWNLLKNALQFSPRGGRVTVRAEAGPEHVVIEVEDQGPGIAAADREHIFDMFFTRRAQGVGVGLALVKQIVDAHGGTIEVRGELGSGTTFRVTLDAAR